MDKEGRGKSRSGNPTISILNCQNIEWQVMNEVALHRGASPHLNTIDAFVDGQHLTESVVRLNCTFRRFFALTSFGHVCPNSQTDSSFPRLQALQPIHYPPVALSFTPH